MMVSYELNISTHVLPGQSPDLLSYSALSDITCAVGLDYFIRKVGHQVVNHLGYDIVDVKARLGGQFVG